MPDDEEATETDEPRSLRSVIETLVGLDVDAAAMTHTLARTLLMQAEMIENHEAALAVQARWAEDVTKLLYKIVDRLDEMEKTIETIQTQLSAEQSA